MMKRSRRAPAAALALAVPILLFAGCGDDDSNTGPDPTPAPCEPAQGEICTWAGTGLAGFNGDGKDLLKSYLYWPIDLTFTSSGAYVLDWNNHRVRRVLPNNTFSTILGTDILGDGPDAEADRLREFTAPGVPGTTVNMNHPTHVTELPDGNILVTSWHNHKLRSVNPVTGMSTIIVGSGPSQPGMLGDGLPMKDARLNQPSQTVLGPDDALYMIDQRNFRVRRFDLTTTLASTVVGSGTAGFLGDGGPPLEAQLRWPAGGNPPPGGGLAFDAEGRLYISDTLNHRVRRVTFTPAPGIIETVVGNGTADFGGDDGPATAAMLNNPRDLEIGPDGRLYIADEFNNRIRVFDPATNVVTTFAGNGTAVDDPAATADIGDGGPALEASLARPTGIEFDAAGDLFIVDTYHHRIRRVNL